MPKDLKNHQWEHESRGAGGTKGTPESNPTPGMRVPTQKSLETILIPIKHCANPPRTFRSLHTQRWRERPTHLAGENDRKIQLVYNQRPPHPEKNTLTPMTVPDAEVLDMARVLLVEAASAEDLTVGLLHTTKFADEVPVLT